MLKFMSIVCVAFGVCALSTSGFAQQAAPSAANQPQTIKRIPLQSFDVPGTAYRTVIGIAEIKPNVKIGRHTHPGPESGYVIKGGFTLLIDGKPERSLKAGDSYQNPPRVVHDAVTGPDGATVIATYVIEKGHPLAIPAN